MEKDHFYHVQSLNQEILIRTLQNLVKIFTCSSIISLLSSKVIYTMHNIFSNFLSFTFYFGAVSNNFSDNRQNRILGK